MAASNIAVIKDVEAFTDPAFFSAVRFVVSTIPFLPFILKARDDTEVRSSGLELGLWVSLGYLSEALGLVSSDAGRASFISLFTVSIFKGRLKYFGGGLWFNDVVMDRLLWFQYLKAC